MRPLPRLRPLSRPWPGAPGVALLALAGVLAPAAARAAETTPAPEPAGRAAAAATEDIRIALADESIPAVLALVEKFTGKSVLIDPALPKTKITFRPARALSKTDAIVALESLLALNGVALTPLGDRFIKAVPAGTVAAQDAPELHLASVAALAPSQRTVARLFTLRRADAVAVAEKIKPIVSGRAVIAVMRDGNAVLVTDALTNLIRLEPFVENLDRAQSELTLELKNTRADTVAARLKTLVAGAYKRRLRGEVAIDAIDGANRIAITTDAANADILRELVALLDVESGTASKVEVFALRHAEAMKIAAVIKELTTGRIGGAGAGGAAGATATVAGDERFSGAFNLVADERSNSLVAQGSPDDLDKLRKLVARLDVLLPQVRIEATIVEVKLGQGEVSGLDTLGLGFKLNPDGSANSGKGDYRFNTGTPGLPDSGGPAFSIGGSVKELSLAAVFNKSELRDKVNVLSAPTIVTTHNKKALINVSQAQPIVTGSASDLQNPSASRSSVTYRDIGIKLEVTPRIGDNGVIQMEVTQTVENIAGTTRIDNNEQPLIGRREATSYLAANDRETIILAGLQSTADRTTKGKIWLLGSIPLLGPWLFQPETVAHERRELIIFLKPYVVDPAKNREEPTPGLRPDALTGHDAKKFIDTGIAPSPLKDTWAEEQRRREAEAAERAAKPPRKEPMKGMHD